MVPTWLNLSPGRAPPPGAVQAKFKGESGRPDSSLRLLPGIDVMLCGKKNKEDWGSRVKDLLCLKACQRNKNKKRAQCKIQNKSKLSEACPYNRSNMA